MKKREKTRIDRMDRRELQRIWRDAYGGISLFKGDTWGYFVRKVREKGADQDEDIT